MSYGRQLVTNFPSADDFVYDYSRGQNVGTGAGEQIVESNLNEPIGLQGDCSAVIIYGTSGGIQTDATPCDGIDWDGSGGALDAFDGTPETGDVNDLGIPGAGASGLTSLNDLDDWTNILYDFANVAGGSFDNFVPLDPITKDIVNEGEFGGDWYDGIIPYHALNGLNHDDDRDGLRGEDPINGVNDDNDCIDGLGGHFFGTPAPDLNPDDCFDALGLLRGDRTALVDEDPASANNLVRRVGDTVRFTFQFFPCSPENGETITAPDLVTQIDLGDFCVDNVGLVMQQAFYDDPANDIEPSLPSPAELTAIGCLPGDSDFVCNPELLTFVDVSNDSTRDMFLQIARLDTERSSDITTQCISDLIPIHVHRDGPNGFYHVLIDTLDLPDGTPNTDPDSFSNGCDALPGAGNYAFDMLLIDTAGNAKLGIDNNNGGTFRLGWTIPEDNFSDYREQSGGVPTSLLVTLLEDALP